MGSPIAASRIHSFSAEQSLTQALKVWLKDLPWAQGGIWALVSGRKAWRAPGPRSWLLRLPSWRRFHYKNYFRHRLTPAGPACSRLRSCLPCSTWIPSWKFCSCRRSACSPCSDRVKNLVQLIALYNAIQSCRFTFVTCSTQIGLLSTIWLGQTESSTYWFGGKWRKFQHTETSLVTAPSYFCRSTCCLPIFYLQIFLGLKCGATSHWWHWNRTCTTYIILVKSDNTHDCQQLTL